MKYNVRYDIPSEKATFFNVTSINTRDDFTEVDLRLYSSTVIEGNSNVQRIIFTVKSS